MNQPRSRRNAPRRGAAIVEFALVLPIIVLLFFAVIEVGRTLLLQHSADTAAYEGARCALVPGATSSSAREAALELLTAARIGDCSILVEPEKIEEDTSVITVQVTIPVAQNSWVVPTFFSNSSVYSEVSLFTERPPVVKLSGLTDLEKKLKSIKNKEASN